MASRGNLIKNGQYQTQNEPYVQRLFKKWGRQEKFFYTKYQLVNVEGNNQKMIINGKVIIYTGIINTKANR